MSEVSFRPARRDDLPAIAALFERSFCDTFAYLYDPADLALFLAKFTPEAWAEEYDDPGHAFLVAEVIAPPLDEFRTGTVPQTVPHAGTGLGRGDVSAERADVSSATPTLPSPIKGEGSRIIGYVKVGPLSVPVTPDRPAIELRQIYFDHAWLGRGLSRPLMDWAIAEARRRGAEELYLTVFTENERARALYQRYGFTEVGPYKFMVGNHADEDIIMRLDL